MPTAGCFAAVLYMLSAHSIQPRGLVQDLFLAQPHQDLQQLVGQKEGNPLLLLVLCLQAADSDRGPVQWRPLIPFQEGSLQIPGNISL